MEQYDRKERFLKEMAEMHYYCTLFDSNYLTRGLAMYHSLAATGDDFFLYVFAFDTVVYKILTAMALPRMHVISLEEFEDERLRAIKQTRSYGEYCWTCSSFSVLYALVHFELDEITYLDSDLYFFYSLDVLLEEFHQSGGDVLITEHRYTPEYNQTSTSGIYCVQFMTFRNNENGRRILQWWCDRCAEWCYNRVEDGKFGDQKYLDDWATRFKGVHVLQHLGGGVAPWNVQQYRIDEGPFVNDIPVVFYHFHALRWLAEHTFDLSTYFLSDKAVQYLYMPYLDALQAALDSVRRIDERFSKGFAAPPQRGFKAALHRFVNNCRRRLRGTYRVIQR